ncbi:MAG TPA: M48 family metallopeptidase [Candidatus Binatia bacterium]|nr:M48 family metallopeptidase [Candidatus Binatia bacterium]
MDFFQRQDNARRRTRWLLVYFAGAILGLAGTFYIISLSPYFYAHPEKTGSFWHPQLFQWVISVVLVVIALGSLTKLVKLRKGGKAIALALGGRPLTTPAPDPDERELQNIIEEMSIASGVPMPAVYVLDREPGINAFAAGFRPEDAVIGVTKGAMQFLNRDELQGIIAHEFSHILNGDMRLNLRLVSWLHGILGIALVGGGLLQAARRCIPWNSENDGLQKAGLGLFFFGSIVGVIIYGLGSAGAFFGRLIKSAVARQREFLADAAAVQFTRNPTGLANALKKIGGLGHGSRIRSPVAEEASHMFFGNGLRSSWFGIFSTHPSLKKRIKLLDPDFDGRFPPVTFPVGLAKVPPVISPPVIPPPVAPPVIPQRGPLPA